MLVIIANISILP